MDFFYGRMSGNSARAAFGLAESGAPHQAHLIDTQTGQNQSAGYRAVNPMGKIPALVDEGLTLWESNAINWYLAEKHPDAGLLPRTLAGRASVQRWLFFQAAHVSPACLPIMRDSSQAMQAFWGFKPDAQAAEGGRKELARYLPVLEQQLTGREWLEEAFSLADIAYTPHLYLVALGGFDLSPYPSVAAWLKRLCARPAWQGVQATIYGAT